MKKIDRKKIAILLNDNARNVNSSIKNEIEKIIPIANIYYTKSLDEADATIAKILNMDFTHVFTGGGDGTLLYFINKMKEIKKEARLKRKLPIVGVLRLGTGNAIAIYTNSGKKITNDINTVLKGKSYKTKAVEFINVDDKYFTFAGFGSDALVLNDYDMMKKIKNKFLRWPFIGLKGYFTSALLITLPKSFINKPFMVEIYSNTGNAYRVSKSKGFNKLNLKKGDLVHRGEFTLMPVGSTPYYGYGLKIIPYADKKKGMFQIRVANIHPLLMLYKVLRAWKGYYENENDVLDFLVDDVTIKFSEPTPFQIAGDPAGYKKELRMKISSENIDFIEFKD